MDKAYKQLLMNLVERVQFLEDFVFRHDAPPPGSSPADTNRLDGDTPGQGGGGYEAPITGIRAILHGPVAPSLPVGIGSAIGNGTTAGTTTGEPARPAQEGEPKEGQKCDKEGQPTPDQIAELKQQLDDWHDQFAEGLRENEDGTYTLVWTNREVQQNKAKAEELRNSLGWGETPEQDDGGYYHDDGNCDCHLCRANFRLLKLLEELEAAGAVDTDKLSDSLYEQYNAAIAKEG